jgi:hypothetical protein
MKRDEGFFSQIGRGLAKLGGLLGEKAGRMAGTDLPYKVTQYDPASNTHHVLTSKWSFAEAYSHPSGTHVVQTHGTEQQLQQIVQGQQISVPSAGVGEAARRAGVGFLLGGMAGAAVGAATSGNRYKQFYKTKWYKLPKPIVTAKSAPSDEATA